MVLFVLAVKAVKQSYAPSSEILLLLENFRLMVNDCVRIGLKEKVTSLKSLSLKAYRQLSNYQVPSYYKLCAISKAAGILKNYRQSLRRHPGIRTPYARRLMLTTCYGFKIENGKLRIPIKPYEYVHVPLNKHVTAVLSELGLTVRAVTLTASTVNISFSKETAMMDGLTGLIGVDRNLDNVTMATSSGEVSVYDLSEASRIKVAYRRVKSHFRRSDMRIRRRIFSKYGLKQKNRVNQILHRASKSIVEKAKKHKYSIVAEKLTGIRKLYRKGNGQGRSYRAQMNSWSYHELQRQIEYKANWEGIPVIYVPPQKTSSICAICGSAIVECAGRKVWCPSCGTWEDRDVNAARNIVARGIRFMPVASPSEAMVQEPSPSEVILTVDGEELTRPTTS